MKSRKNPERKGLTMQLHWQSTRLIGTKPWIGSLQPINQS